jgi:NADPH:quinone reductase-like Zn-dependent oxidoreductase
MVFAIAHGCGFVRACLQSLHLSAAANLSRTTSTRFGKVDGWRIRMLLSPRQKKRRGLKIISYDVVTGVREFERLNQAIKKAKLQVPIAAEFPLEEAAEAHRRIEQWHRLGKIVLRVG